MNNQTDSAYIVELTTNLMARLPELEWKISKVNHYQFIKSIPKKLFRGYDLSPAHCFEELKSDIRQLASQKSQISAHYLAEQINNKINVLVGLCRVEKKSDKKNSFQSFTLNQLSTRQQWISALELNMDTLQKQHKALTQRIEHAKSNSSGANILLNLTAELGELEKHLTLAQESLNKATSVQIY